MRATLNESPNIEMNRRPEEGLFQGSGLWLNAVPFYISLAKKSLQATFLLLFQINPDSALTKFKGKTCHQEFTFRRAC